MAKARNISEIDCGGPSAAAIRLVLITRFEEMYSLRDRALDWNDPEGVHDMRVSSRRLRGALHDFMPYVHKRRLTGVLKEVGKLAAVLGAVRDQDVAIMGLKTLAEGAPDEAASVLDQLIKTRDTNRARARRDLKRSLQKGELNQLQSDFDLALERATTNSKSATKPGKSQPATAYSEIARLIILERLSEVEKLSKGLYQPLKIKPLHKMRIAAKRLRYALELFEPCWGPGISPFARKIASLQTSLGELHDADIWIEGFRDHMDKEKPSGTRAGGELWLLSHFIRLHSKRLRNALEHWRDWEVGESGHLLRQVLHENPTANAPIDPQGTQEDDQQQPIVIPGRAVSP